MAIEIDDDAREYINEGFAERLEANSPDVADVLVEVESGALDDVVSRLEVTEGVGVSPGDAIGGKFVPASVPVDMIPAIARVDGVELIHQDQPAGILAIADALNSLPLPHPRDNKLRRRSEEWLLQQMAVEGDFDSGRFPGPTETPRFNLMLTPFFDPVQAGLSAVNHYTDAEVYDATFIPTGVSVDWMLDGDVTVGAAGADTQVAVLDTGYTPQPVSMGGRVPYRESQVPGEPGLDMQAHGSWCTNTVAGRTHPTPWGSAAGVAPQSQVAHFKCLNTFPGFGMTSWILRSMDRALEWGADVISMSLGGLQQGPIDEDPYCRFIRENCKENAGESGGAIFVVAAGNAGPTDWTIGSPGISEKAITVGSWSLTDQSPSAFSSRGPQGEWYYDHEERYQSDLSEYGADEFVKPDCTAPGGGRKTLAESDDNDELLWQASTGWMEGFYDGIRDGTGGMKGTSMACPHVAGLVTRLYDAGIITTASEFKRVTKDNAVVEEYEDAAEYANRAESGKNVAVGFGPVSESVFQP